MDHGVNRLINRKAADAGEGLSRYELPLEQAAMSDHRLDRLVKALARYTGLSASVLKERAEPLRLYSHIALRSSSGDRRVVSCGGSVGASCFWRGEEAPEYAAVSVDSTGSDSGSDSSSEDAEYYGEALLLFELRLKAANANGPPPPPEQLCYLAYLERVDALAATRRRAEVAAQEVQEAQGDAAGPDEMELLMGDAGGVGDSDTLVLVMLCTLLSFVMYRRWRQA